MNHQNEMNYPPSSSSSSSSSYYNFYQSEFQNPIPNPQFDHHLPSATNASAPPDPSIYYSSDYSNNYLSAYYPNDRHNGTPHTPDSSNPSYDPNSMPSWHHHQSQNQDQNPTAVIFGGGTVDGSAYGGYSAGSSGRHAESHRNPNPTAVNFGGGKVYDYTPGNNGRQAESSMEVRFDDYGRPISSAADGGKKIDSYDQSVYAYSGGGNKVKNDLSSRAPVLQFDDYGRPITNGSGGGNEQRGPMASLDGDRISKAAAKVEAKEDVRNGVQKFRVILLSEGGGLQGNMDVLCQIGLDGIQILDPATSRTLKVYSLETVTKWEVLDSNIFAFWTKSAIDINERRVRLKSNSYTTTKILDMVAAASYQFKEMDGVTISEQQPSEKKKGFPDWINLMKPTNEEKDHWVPDEASTKCTACSTYFGAFVRRHHCRNCGDIFCDKCTQGRIALTAEENAQQVRVCDQCMAEVTQRLSHVNAVAGRSSGFNRHEDLAKKLQEEMEKKRKTTTELKSNQRMKEVECPTCTVHLQVDVPASGSKTIECSVCQHPFLVSA